MKIKLSILIKIISLYSIQFEILETVSTVMQRVKIFKISEKKMTLFHINSVINTQNLSVIHKGRQK